MEELPQKTELPAGVVKDERPPFIPRMVMTPQIACVVKNVMAQWRQREKFEGLAQYGIRPLDRLLFFGPPGNGKTLTCYWMAKEMRVPVYRVLCNQLHGSYLGATTRAVADVCQFLDRVNRPAICLWDEVEAIFVDRRRSRGECDREIGSALTVFMQSLDRLRSPTLMVLATNLVEQLDEALLSRVEMRLEFGGPTDEQAEQLLNYWCELLANYGAEKWGPGLRERIKQQRPESFRELQQRIGFCAREWVAQQCS